MYSTGMRFNRHSGARVKRATLESIITIGSMDSGPAPQVGNCRPKAHPEMTRVEWTRRPTAPPSPATAGCSSKSRPFYAGLWAHEFCPNKKHVGGTHDDP